MDNSKCKFCSRGEELKKKFLPISVMEGSYLYLFRNQYYKGRCCLILKNHYKLLSQIPQEEARLIFNDVYTLTNALKEIFNPDSFDIASFGDATDHFHIHIVPKYKETDLYGKPYYIENAPFEELPEKETNNMIEIIRTKIGGDVLE